MIHKEIRTLGELKKSGCKSRTIKEELRENLLANIREGKNSFEGIRGFEDTVIPDVERAILSGHNINFLGLRGQAKTKIARMLTGLLDEYIPVIKGHELHEDPLKPITHKGKEIIKEQGDDTPLRWLHRSERYYEKLATPDVSVADLIGDIDPVKAASSGYGFNDERAIHYGMIPRAHRCIFVINELPDLQPRLQVALFNILQEGDIQIRGFNIRLKLDVQFIFTANPEDYTNRGSIVTPLKDRIGSQILTHYPEDIATARKITAQEAAVKTNQRENIYVPDIAFNLLEQVSFEARKSEYIDAKSGVSARLGISALENLLSGAELRILKTGETKTSVRLIDFMGIIPAITGKIELVYEGEQEGAGIVAENLIASAVKTLIAEYVPEMDKLKASDPNNKYRQIIDWFSHGNSVDLFAESTDDEYRAELQEITPLLNFLEKYQPGLPDGDKYFLMEMILWALAEYARLNKEKIKRGFNFSDLFSSYLRSEDLYH